MNLAQEAEDLFVMRRELVALRKHDTEQAEKLQQAELRIAELEQIVGWINLTENNVNNFFLSIQFCRMKLWRQ